MIAKAAFTIVLLSVFGTLLPLLDAQVKSALPDYKTEVAPILQSHCVRCHGPKKQESRVRLDTLSPDVINDRAAAEYWHEVLNVLNAGEMPPEDAEPLSSKQRDILTRWVSAAVERAKRSRHRTDGRVVLRRLNRVEFQNTMVDLLGTEMDYVRDLPPDAVSSDGFRNDGRSLQMSALQLEYHLKIAREALERVIVVGPEPKVFRHTFENGNVRNWLGKGERANRLGRQQEFLAKMVKDYPDKGDFRIRVKLTADLKSNIGYPLLEASVGYRPDTEILFRALKPIEISSPDEQLIELRGRLEDFPLPVRGQGKYPGLVVRLRNVYDDGSARPNGKRDKARGTAYPEESHLPTITIQSVDFQAPAFDAWPPAAHRRILFESPLREKNEPAYVAEVLRRFMRRAFRRPVEEREVKAMVDFHESIRELFPTFEESMIETLAMVLIRPDFLYLLEPGGDTKRTVGDWELASRLSYFLWSTMPDRRLMDLASKGDLRKSSVLSAEVERMLEDPRSSHFVEQFTGQWLQLNVIESVAISREYYPGFDDKLKQDMCGEIREFFAELLRHNQSAVNLLSSDFTMLNEPLAKHYGVEGVYGKAFRRVTLHKDSHRGGLLGHAGVLLSNSTGLDSHAVRRAVWIRDRLLNDPPAPPPPDVPSLDEADPRFHQLSVREQLEVHRDKEACANCHRNIDPWGIALENFDAVGLWREEVRRKNRKRFEKLPVVAKDSLPGGEELDGVDGLKNYLLTKKKNVFARSLVSRLLTYALGRRLELTDQQAVDDITDGFAKDGYRLRGLVRIIATSEPFQTK